MLRVSAAWRWSGAAGYVTNRTILTACASRRRPAGEGRAARDDRCVQGRQHLRAGRAGCGNCCLYDCEPSRLRHRKPLHTTPSRQLVPLLLALSQGSRVAVRPLRARLDGHSELSTWLTMPGPVFAAGRAHCRLQPAQGDAQELQRDVSPPVPPPVVPQPFPRILVGVPC